MINYRIVSSVSLTVLYFLFHLFLRKEKMFGFNRVFLPGALAISVAMPLIEIPLNAGSLLVHVPIIREVPIAIDDSLMHPELLNSNGWMLFGCFIF